MGFSRAKLESYRDASVPDLVGPGLKLLFVGINPGLWTAATQTHFAHPGNRFYPALRAGRTRLADFVAAHRPVVVAVAGVTAYRAAFGQPKARPGEQPETLGDARLWVVPNPSGLNAHETAASLAVAYAAPARAAGVI